jgi:hypothetical protein
MRAVGKVEHGGRVREPLGQRHLRAGVFARERVARDA